MNNYLPVNCDMLRLQSHGLSLPTRTSHRPDSSSTPTSLCSIIMGKTARRGTAKRRSGTAGKVAKQEFAGPKPVVLDAKTRTMLAGIDDPHPAKRASACDALEAALSMGTTEKRHAIAVHVMGSGAIERVLSLLHDPFSQVCVAAASAVRCLAAAGAAEVCDALASTSAPSGLLHCLAKTCTPHLLATAFKAASMGEGYETFADSTSTEVAAAVAVPSALAPGAALAKPATGATRLQLAQEVIGAINELAKGSDAAVALLLQIASRGDVVWPPAGAEAHSTPFLVPLPAILGPIITCLELPAQARATGAWGAAGSAAAASASPGGDPAAAAAFHSRAMAACSTAQTAAAETLHTLADGTPALAASLLAAPGSIARLAAVMGDAATTALASLHIAGALLCIAAGASHAAGAAGGLPEEAGTAAAAALKTALAGVGVEITGAELQAALAASSELKTSQDVLAGVRDVAGGVRAETDSAAAGGAAGLDERSPDETALAEASAEEAAVEAAERTAAEARQRWEDSRTAPVTLACQVLSSAVSGSYAVSGSAVAGSAGEGGEVEVLVEGVRAGSVAVLGAADATAVVDRAMLAVLSLLNGSAAAGGSAEASGLLTEAWARREVAAVGEAMASLRGTMAHSLPPADGGAAWARLQALLAAADWRQPPGSTAAVAYARRVAAGACLPGLLVAAQALLEAAAASGAGSAAAAAAASAGSHLAPGLCATAAEAVAAAAAGQQPATPVQARALSLACLAQLPALSPALLGNAAALTAIAGALDGGLQDQHLEVVAEALICAFDVFGADGAAVLPTAKAVGLAAKVEATVAATRARLSSAEGKALEPDTRARCIETVQNGVRFAEYLRTSGAV